MQNKTQYQIKDHPGTWTIKNSWVSDLGYIMIAFWSEERGVIMNVNTQTTLQEALELPYKKSQDIFKSIDPDEQLKHLY